MIEYQGLIGLALSIALLSLAIVGRSAAARWWAAALSVTGLSALFDGRAEMGPIWLVDATIAWCVWQGLQRFRSESTQGYSSKVPVGTVLILAISAIGIVVQPIGQCLAVVLIGCAVTQAARIRPTGAAAMAVTALLVIWCILQSAALPLASPSLAGVALALNLLLPLLLGIALIMLATLGWLTALQRMAMVDELTGIDNRRAFNEALTRLIAARDRGTVSGSVTVMMFDLDDLKDVNDHLGHAAGDHALCAFVSGVRQSLRTDDLFARIGGDEFAALLMGCGEEDVAKISTRLDAAIGRIKVGAKSLRASYGHAHLGASDSVETIMARADHAMQAAKSQRKRSPF